MELYGVVFVVFCGLIMKNVDAQRGQAGTDVRDQQPTVAPRITSRPQYFRSRLNETVEFRCEVENQPGGVHRNWIRQTDTIGGSKQSLSLSFDDVPLSGDPRIAVSGKGTVLRISNITLKDEGQYTCALQPTTPLISQENRLEIIIPPSVTMRPDTDLLSFPLGEELRLQCIAKGRPTPQIQWMKDSAILRKENITDNGDLFIPRLGRSDGGTYRCIADNGIGRAAMKEIEVEVNFKPLASVRYEKVVTALNKRLSIECFVSAYPTAAIVWLKNGTMVDRSGKTATAKTISNVDAIANLEIERVREEDLGAYLCKATNPLGNSTADLEVTVLPQRLRITSPIVGPYSDMYKLKWQVATEETPVEYHLLFTQSLTGNTTEWANSTLPVTDTDIRNGIHHQSYKIKGLTANTTYYVKLQAQNTAGLSDWTSEFEFSTSPERHDPIITVEPTQPDTIDNGGGAASFLLPSLITLIISALVSFKL